jgi:hypothetical protein
MKQGGPSRAISSAPQMIAALSTKPLVSKTSVALIAYNTTSSKSQKCSVHQIPSALLMEANLFAADAPIRLAEIRLGVTWTMAQRHEHLPRP